MALGELPLVLNLLGESPVSYRRIEEEFREELDDVEDHDDRSIERIRRRAVEDLQLWRVAIVDTGSTLSIDRSNRTPGSQARLHLPREQAHFRDEIAGWLRVLDPGHQVDPVLIEKVHIRDRLAFTYGTPPRSWEGIPYLFRHDERPALLVRTSSGDHGFWSDAIRTVTVLVPNAGDVQDGDPDAQVIDTSPVTGSWQQRRGRPHDVVTLRRAQRVIAAIRSLAAPGTNATAAADTMVSFRDVARRTTEKLKAVRSLAPLVGSLDPNIYDDEDHFVVSRSYQGADLDGAEAIIARLELGAILALTDGARELSASFTDANLHAWRDVLDQFLSRATIRDAVEPVACGRELVAAAIYRDALDAVIVLNGEQRLGLLEVHGLHWHRLRWWVDGRFDGRPLGKAELPVVDVLEMHEP